MKQQQIKTQSSDVSCLESPPILKSIFSSPAVHALCPQVFLGQRQCQLLFCYSRHFKRSNQSIKAKVARLITSAMTLLLVVTLDYQKIVSPQPQTASHECNALISKSASFCQIISRRCENEIKRLSRSRGIPVMSSVGEGYSGRSRCGSFHIARPQNEEIGIEETIMAIRWITIYANSNLFGKTLATSFLKVSTYIHRH